MRTQYAPIAVIAVLLMLAPLDAKSQHAEESIVHRQHEEYVRYAVDGEAAWDSVNGRRQPAAPMPVPTAACHLGSNVVFGWNPYWVGTAYRDYDYSLLSDICYFSYDVDPATGSYASIHSWKTTDLVSIAKAAGVRVHLCVVLFERHATLLGNSASRARLIDSLVELVRLRGADGVNIDFEAIPASQRAAFASFMIDLGNRFHHDLPGSRVSIALPAVDWNNAFDVAAMIPAVDLFIIMGYDFHWSGSDNAGPVAPKNGGTRWGAYDVTRSVNDYLRKGIPPEHLALGVPYYGYEWATTDSTIAAPTTSTGTAVVYSTARQRAAQYGRRWDDQSSTPWFVYRSDSTWRQCWYDDATSLRMKYEMVAMKRLAGIGIWALSYDGSVRDLWDAIAGVFSDCAASPCEGSFSDMGGPAGNYYDGERYVFTIAPAGAQSVRLAFNSFNVADDRLTIFDGRDTAAPIIGDYSGTASPGTVTGTRGALTLRFVSNGSTTSWGWTSTWLCTEGPSGVDDAFATVAASTMTLAPNPARAESRVTIGLTRPARVSMALYDVRGAAVISADDGWQPAGTYRHDLDLAGLPAGRFLLRLTAGATTVVRVLVHE